MPLIFRHLAAAVLPLSATAAGILAVGIAVQLPRGPAPVVCSTSRRQPARAGSRCRRTASPRGASACSACRTGVGRASILGCNRERPVRRPWHLSRLRAPDSCNRRRRSVRARLLRARPRSRHRPKRQPRQRRRLPPRRRLRPRSPRSLPRPQARVHRVVHRGRRALRRLPVCRPRSRQPSPRARSTPRRKQRLPGRRRRKGGRNRRIRRSPAMEARRNGRSRPGKKDGGAVAVPAVQPPDGSCQPSGRSRR